MNRSRLAVVAALAAVSFGSVASVASADPPKGGKAEQNVTYKLAAEKAEAPAAADVQLASDTTVKKADAAACGACCDAKAKPAGAVAKSDDAGKADAKTN